MSHSGYHILLSDMKEAEEARCEQASYNVNGEPIVVVTEEDNKRILGKTDSVILVIICWVYFLQIIDKQVISYSAIFGLQQDTHLHGNQYSFIGSIGYIAQLGWQPFSALLIVKVPPRILAPTLVFFWGISLTGMVGARDYYELLATRFLLGFFEAACLPLFAFIVSNWYRRAEQPLRIASFYSMNGVATIIGSAIVFGLGHIKTTILHSYQIIFLSFGLITIFSAPFIYWRLDNAVASARFLTPEDRLKGIERLRANQQVIDADGTAGFKWHHVLECALELKTWVFVGMTLLLNIGASVTSIFGPLILAGLGFSPYMASLLNIPFGGLQLLVIMGSSWLVYNFKRKGFIFALLVLPVLAGCAMLYGLGRAKSEQPALLAAYYMIAFLFGGNPLIISWIAGNTAGQSKKSTMLALYQAASSAGNIIGPILFRSADKPYYKPGLKAVLCCFSSLLGLIMLQIVNLMTLNKLKEKQRIANGKPAKLHDLSMTKHFAQVLRIGSHDVETGSGSGLVLSQNAAAVGYGVAADLTDRENDEFQYIL